MIALKQVAPQTFPDATGGIPIRNFWHMLLYAWDRAAFLNRWNAEVEAAPSLDALFASLLSKLVEQRLRIGLVLRKLSTFERPVKADLVIRTTLQLIEQRHL